MRSIPYISLLFMCLSVGALASPVHGQTLTDDVPGLVNFDAFDQRFGIPPSFEVNIQGKLLQLVSEASREEDPELSELLDRLHAIQVRGFPMQRSQFRMMENHSREIATELEDAGWNTVVKLRDYGEYVDVYAKENATYIEGLMMMVVDNELRETVLINIVGNIQAEELGRIGSRFDIAPLENVMNDR